MPNECGLCHKTAAALTKIRIRFYTMVLGRQFEDPVDACPICMKHLHGSFSTANGNGRRRGASNGQ
mgnify:CR=1 FL=1